MVMQVGELRELLEDGQGREVVLSDSVLGVGDPFRLLTHDGVLRVDATASDPVALRVTGTTRTALAGEPVPVRLVFEHHGEAVVRVVLETELPEPGVRAGDLARRLGVDMPDLPDNGVTRLRLVAEPALLTLSGLGEHDRMALLRRDDERLLFVENTGWRVLCTSNELTEQRLAELDLRLPAGLAAGDWLLLPDGTAVPIRGERVRPPLDPRRVDGLGRALPAAPTTTGSTRVGTARAVPTRDGFAVLGLPGSGRKAGWGGIGDAAQGKGVSIDHDAPPLKIAGALNVVPAKAPYRVIVGGVLLWSFKALYGSAMGAVVVPESGTAPSFFGFGAVGADPGIGIPGLRISGIAAGMGYNSRMRVPGSVDDLDGFPFLQALKDPAAIGGDPGDPVSVLGSLVKGSSPWVAPKRNELWLAAGLAFSVAEIVHARALAVVQTGDELTIALMGLGGTEFPKGGGKKYAKVEIGLLAVIKPRQGELMISAQLTPDSFLLDENCKLRGGAALKVWYGDNSRAGDLVFTLGGYHPNYQVPSAYPLVPRVGFDWALGGNVTVSGDAYFAITPEAVMVGGGLDVRFHAGPVRAWCLAEVDALVRWKPFSFDVGVKVSIGVSASVKILFVRITITVEVGVSLRVWGPPTGGQARIHLWFISFTIDFGHSRSAVPNTLDWNGFREMLPPAGSNVRVIPGAGLIEVPVPGGSRSGDAWLVSSAGFCCTTDSTVPVTELYLDGRTGAPAERGGTLNIRPMQETGRTSVQVVSLTRDGTEHKLTAWSRIPVTATVPQALWGTGTGTTLPTGDGHLIKDQLVGIRLASPPLRNGTSTGYIGEDALAFDPIRPNGPRPLDPDAPPTGAVPRRPAGGGVIRRIVDTVAADRQVEARERLAGRLADAGLDLGLLDNDLSAYSRAAGTAFTAEPMLAPATSR
ncbi:DUF6603 domain-containing protein [Saccharothrix sp. DSM 118769]